MNEPGARALILAGVGTVVIRADGSAVFTDRNRQSTTIDAAVVRAIAALSSFGMAMAAPARTEPAPIPYEEPTL
jgi:hypothetical protein